MKKLETFGHVEVATLTEKDIDNPQWLCDHWGAEWTLKEDLEDLLQTIRDHVEKEPSTFLNISIEKVSNHKFMENYIYGQPFDDDCSAFTRKECPECSHLLVTTHRDEEESNGHFCSNYDCSYMDEKLKAYSEEQEKLFKRDKKPEPRIYDVGLNLEQFCEKYNIDLKRNPIKTCAICKQEIEPADWWLMKSGMAIVSFEHEGCDNGPAVAVPFSKTAKEKWSNLLF